MKNFSKPVILFFLSSIIPLYLFPQTGPNLKSSATFPQLLIESQKFQSEGLYEQALQSLNQSLKLARTVDDQKAVILNIANVQANLGNISRAYDYYRQCLELARQLKDDNTVNFCQKSLEIIDLYNAAKKLRQSSQHQEAIEIFQKAISICDEINNEILKIKSLRQQSLAYLNSNDLRSYLKCNIRAKEIAKRINNINEIVTTLNNIGYYHLLIDNINLAIENYHEALDLSKDKSIPPDILLASNYNIGIVYNEIGNYEQAISCFNFALNLIATEKTNPYYSSVLNSLGFSYIKKALSTGKRDDYDKAFEYFNEAFSVAESKINEQMRVITLNNLGSLKAHLGENLDALYYLNKARGLAEKIKLNSYLVSIYTNIGIIYARQGDYQNSSLYYDKAINLALRENENRTLWESYLEKGNLLRKQDKIDEARFYYLNSINIIESLRSKLIMEEDKASFLGTDKRLDTYHNLVDLLVNIKKDRSSLEQAFNFMERAKARAFLESIEASKISQQAPADIKLVNQEKEIMSDMSKLYTRLISPELEEEERSNILKEIKNQEDKLESIKRQMRSQNPVYAKLTYPEIISYQQAKKEFVDARTAVFAFLVGRDSAYAFCLTRKGLKAYPIPSQKDLRDKVINHRKAISDTDNSDFSSGQELYEILLKPGLIEGIKNLIIIPDDILNLLPFETLLTTRQSNDWLIRHYTIYYAPSLSSLRELVRHQNRKNRGKPGHNLLAVGDPYYGELEDKYAELSTKTIFQDFYTLADLKFYRLRYSHEEIKRISSLIPRTTALEREKATEDLIKSANLSDYRIIHFAAHGLIDDQKPARSAIVLTLDNDPTEDGFLQMREVFNLKMNSDLIVLSSCQTGLGQFIRGEGIEGIGRAFFFAGASSVLMTLWTINDQVSSQFMERFYFHLKSSESSAQALRQVKLEMVDSGVVSHPYYWAPFILTGDGSSKVFVPTYKTPLLVIASTLAGLVVTAFVFRKRALNHKNRSGNH